jgi:TolB protein
VRIFAVALAAISAFAQTPAPAPKQTSKAPQQRLRSKVVIFDLASKQTRVVHTADTVWEAPNWTRDGKFLVSNSGGALYRIPVDGKGAPEKLAVPAELSCNNDHDFSRDGKWLAISASSPTARGSQVYIVNADGTNPRQVTTVSPSYFHGWSPDGKYVSLVAQRNGSSYDLYRIPFAGGAEERLTSNAGYDDGPDYSPDGKWIYFNSDRGSGWNVWRIPASGGGPDDAKAERITNDDLEDWFPHASPNSKWMVFLSFPAGTTGHGSRMPGVQLRIIPMPGKTLKPAKIETLLTFFGGQGTINVNSWSPDSKQFAFVQYEPIQ